MNVFGMAPVLAMVRSSRLLGLQQELLDEREVLALADAITDRAGAARHGEVLAKCFGQLLAAGLGQGEDALVGAADLRLAERNQSWISSSRLDDCLWLFI